MTAPTPETASSIPVIVSLGSLLVAVVAVIVGPLLQWKIAKRQAADNISAKRQVWIDELRKDAARLITLLESMRQRGQLVSIGDEERRTARAKVVELMARINLRLNPEEREHTEFLELARKLVGACLGQETHATSPAKTKTDDHFDVHLDQAIQVLQKILKQEWVRIKRGDV